MLRIVLWRHGITAWNLERRIQGHRDQPLCDEGRTELRTRRVPEKLRTWKWISSPLRRALETAATLSGRPADDIPTDRRLMEMDWGQWEGELLEDLRARYGQSMVENEARGLAFRPTGGESPADVLVRALDCVRAVAATGHDHVIVTHKGVIRVLMAHATGWDMTGKAPVKLDWSRPHFLKIDADGGIDTGKFNLVGDEPELA